MQPKSKMIQAFCSVHGKATKRNTCRLCNAAYMRTYLRRRRFDAPERALWERARRRAAQSSLLFRISLEEIRIPSKCPVFGIPLLIGRGRSENSPSLDRIIPERGYVPGNVRVISDRANRLKSDRTLNELTQRASTGPRHFREEYRLIADYVSRELAVGEVREKLAELGATDDDWRTIKGIFDRLATVASDGFEAPVPETTRLTSAKIENEFGLTKQQVRKLRRFAGFPRPIRKRDGFRFLRAEVEQWIARQPDPSNPAAVLDRKKRARMAVNSKAAALLRAEFFAGAHPSQPRLR